MCANYFLGACPGGALGSLLCKDPSFIPRVAAPPRARDPAASPLPGAKISRELLSSFYTLPNGNVYADRPFRLISWKVVYKGVFRRFYGRSVAGVSTVGSARDRRSAARSLEAVQFSTNCRSIKGYEREGSAEAALLGDVLIETRVPYSLQPSQDACFSQACQLGNVPHR